jgi:hypothetical protein
MIYFTKYDNGEIFYISPFMIIVEGKNNEKFCYINGIKVKETKKQAADKVNEFLRKIYKF